MISIGDSKEVILHLGNKDGIVGKRLGEMGGAYITSWWNQEGQWERAGSGGLFYHRTRMKLQSEIGRKAA